MTVYAPEAPARAVKRATRRTQTAYKPLELFDEATLAGLKPSPMLHRLGLLDPRHWFTATDLFCGAGGTTTGFEAAMIEGKNIVDTLQVVNHDWLAIASHAANHAAARHFIEDITKLDASLLVKTSLLWASLECFPADTLVLTSTGQRPIQELAVGDLVLTHKGRWRAVTDTMRKNNAPTYTVRGQGHPGLTTTEEHPFYVRRQQRTWNQGKRLYDYKTMGEPQWATTSELAATTSGIKNRWRWATPTTIPATPETAASGVPPIGPRVIHTTDSNLWWLVGRWLGDGSIQMSGQQPTGIEISAGNHEADALFDKLATYWDRPEAESNATHMLRWKRRQLRTVQLLSASHTDLAKWLISHFGRLSHGKHLPSWLYGLPESYRQQVLDGYLSADGHKAKSRTQATTVSKKLAIGMRLLAEGLGYRTSMHRYDARPETSVIEGRSVNVREQWVVAFDNEKSGRASFEDGTHAWSLGKGVAATGKLETVYNISVEEDESYVVEGIVVHNCTNFSNAKGGQSRDADSRSLAEHMERYIQAVNPLYFCVENVREFLAWGPLVHKKDKYGRPMFRSVKKLAQRHSKTGEPLFSAKSGKPLTQQVVDSGGNLVFEQKPVMVPESRTKGRDFIRWKQSIEDLGYVAHQTLLNAADYGERTSRIRLFMVFAKKGMPVRWPQATHSNPRKKGGLTVGTQPWLPVRPCLDLEVKGRSIFNRVRLDKQGNVKLNKKGESTPAPLVEKTLKRLFAGLCQYIAGSTVPTVTAQLQQLRLALLLGRSGGSQQPKEAAQTEWLAKRTSNPPSGKANPGASLNEPGPAVACGFHPDLVQVEGTTTADDFLVQSNGGPDSAKVTPTTAPSRTVLASPNQSLAQVVPVAPVAEEFLTTRHHTDPECRGRSLVQPAATIMPKDNHELAQVVGAPAEDGAEAFVTQYNGGSDECRNLSVEAPINTITPANRFGVVQPVAAAGEFLTNPGWPERCGGAPTSEPGPTIVARQDKAPLSLIQAVGTGEVGFVQKYYSSGPNVTSLNDPSGSLTCTDRMALAQVEANSGAGAWLDKRFGSGDHNHQPLTAPGGAILTNDHHVLAQVESVGPPVGEFLDQQYGASGPASVEDPAGSLTGTPKLNLAQTEPWIVKTDYNRVGTSLDEPSSTLTASRHYPYLAQPVSEPTEPEAQGEWLLDNKFDNTGRPLTQCGPTLLTGDHQYLAQTEPVAALEPENWQFQDDDSETMQLIRLFLRAYNLSDVLLRMLLVKELLAIQGFPADYVLKGSSTDAKRFIGNSVPPKMSQRITEALYEAVAEAGLLDRLTEYTGSLVVNKTGRLAEGGDRRALAA